MGVRFWGARPAGKLEVQTAFQKTVKQGMEKAKVSRTRRRPRFMEPL